MDNSFEATFISRLIRTEEEVKIIMQNGFQMRGIICNHDDVVIVLMERAKSGEIRKNIVYKHAISTIVMPT